MPERPVNNCIENSVQTAKPATATTNRLTHTRTGDHPKKLKMTSMSDCAGARPRRDASITRRQTSTVAMSLKSFAASRIVHAVSTSGLPGMAAFISKNHCNSPGLEFKDVAAAPGQNMQVCQSAANSRASTAFYLGVIGSMCRIRNLDRQAAALAANSFEAEPFLYVLLRQIHRADAHPLPRIDISF